MKAVCCVNASNRQWQIGDFVFNTILLLLVGSDWLCIVRLMEAEHVTAFNTALLYCIIFVQLDV